MSWLSGWRRRIKLTIDHDDIDAALSWFPVLVYLSTSSGIGGVDVSCVFDELESDDNRKKIAVTKADGVTQLYVEIERWDDANEVAWLWVSRNGWAIADDADTVIYLYYDSSKPDNGSYVGDTNSTPAENVWDTSYELVAHARDDPDTSHVKDSTSNNNDGAKTDADEPVEAAGQIDKAQAFDGTDDEIDFGYPVALGELTIEWWMKSDQGFGAYSTILEFVSAAAYIGFHIKSAVGEWYLRLGVDNVRRFIGGLADITGWHYYVLYLAGSGQNDIDNSAHWQDNSQLTNSDTVKTGGITAWDEFVVGGGETYGFTDCVIDEVRVSSGARTAAWRKASYESGRDDLLAFGSEEKGGIGPFPTHFVIR